MNNWPNELQYLIYEYKHNIEFNEVMNELKKIKMRCFFNIDMGLADMKYLNHDKILVKCVNINNFNVTSTQILNYMRVSSADAIEASEARLNIKIYI